MVEEAVACTAPARKQNFFPYPKEALMVEKSLYIENYPQFYFGHGKSGYPVFISQPGKMNLDKMGCLTSVPAIIDYHWYAMMHEYVAELDSMRRSNGNFKRYECICILDLANLTPRKLGKRALDITKAQSFIDSLCFPEILNKMIILNAPGYFTMTWKIIRGWIDERTANKVDVIGHGKEKILRKLSNYIDPDQIPGDYGGNAQSIASFLRDDMLRVADSERIVGSTLQLQEEDGQLVSYKGHTSKSIFVESKQTVKLSFLSRMVDGHTITVKNTKTEKVLASVVLKHDGKSDDEVDEIPTRVDLEKEAGAIVLEGPATYTVDFVSNGPRRKHMHLLMVVKTFAHEQAKTVSAPQDADIICKFVSDQNVGPNISICTGDFPDSQDDTELSVQASPHAERRMAIAARKKLSTLSSQNSSGEDYCVPEVERKTNLMC